MTVNDPIDSATGDSEDQHRTVARKNRGVRFSDSEWEEVREAAGDHGITPAEFVRERILELVRSPSRPASPALPTHLTPLIEHTFRYTYMLATKMRDDLLADDKGEELDHLIKEARALQDSLTSVVSQ